MMGTFPFQMKGPAPFQMKGPAPGYGDSWVDKRSKNIPNWLVVRSTESGLEWLQPSYSGTNWLTSPGSGCLRTALVAVLLYEI